jgi:hypothetical protein
MTMYDYRPSKYVMEIVAKTKAKRKKRRKKFVYREPMIERRPITEPKPIWTLVWTNPNPPPRSNVTSRSKGS